MEMGFQVGGSVSFGFHVGGGSAPQPPEPSDHKCALTGAALPAFDGHGMMNIPPVVGIATRRIITVSGNGLSANVDTIADARALLESGAGYDTVDIAEDSGITTISSNAFYSENGLPLKSIFMPGVRTIDKNAFKNCTNLEQVIFSPYLTAINGNAFQNCTSLKSVDLSSCDSLTAIASYVFKDCTSLKTVTLPANGNLTSLQQQCFNNCTALEGIVIPDTVTTIGNSVFNGCANLGEVHLSTSLTTLGEYAFKNCENLGNVSAIEGITFGVPEGCTGVGFCAFQNCLKIAKFYIPSSIYTNSFGALVGTGGTTYDAFSGCIGLLEIHVNKNRGHLSGSPWGAPNRDCVVVWNDD